MTQTVKTVLTREGIRSADLSIVFVNDSKMKSLNKAYLGRSYATDVLAFNFHEQLPLEKKKQSPESRQEVCGEIIISAAMAARNGREFGSSVQEELQLYVIHGLLHLLGFDDGSASDKERMREKERELMESVPA